MKRQHIKNVLKWTQNYFVKSFDQTFLVYYKAYVMYKKSLYTSKQISFIHLGLWGNWKWNRQTNKQTKTKQNNKQTNQSKMFISLRGGDIGLSGYLDLIYEWKRNPTNHSWTPCSMTIRLIQLHQLETLYISYEVKCQSGVIWGHKGVKGWVPMFNLSLNLWTMIPMTL